MRYVDFIALAVCVSLPGWTLHGCGRDAPPSPADGPGALAALPSAAPAVAESLLEARFRALDPARPETVDAVVELGTAALPTLREWIGGADDARAIAAVAVYGAAGGALPAPDLVDVLQSARPARQMAALDAVDTLRDPTFVGTLIGLLGGPNDELSVRAAAVLGGFDDPRVPQALLPWLKVERGGRSDAAAAALAATPALDGVAPLVALLDDDRPGVKARVVSVLHQRRAVDAVPALRRLVADASAHVREAAFRAVVDLAGPSAAADAIRDALSANSPTITRRSAIERVAALDPETAAPLVFAACTDPDVAVRRIAMGQVGRHPAHPEYVTAVTAGLRDAAPTVRLAAVEALGAATNRGWIVATLVAQLDRESHVPVFAAMGAVLKRHDALETVFPIAIRGLRGDEGVVVDGFAALLQQMTGQPFGTDWWAWQQWHSGGPAPTRAPASDAAAAAEGP